MREDLENDLRALLGGPATGEGATRRTGLKAALGAGYAAAAGPLMAQTAIRTPADGLTVGEISYEAPGTTAAQASRFVVYPEAPHAFHADYRPSDRQGAAEDGWNRALAWFRTHGVA